MNEKIYATKEQRAWAVKQYCRNYPDLSLEEVAGKLNITLDQLNQYLEEGDYNA